MVFRRRISLHPSSKLGQYHIRKHIVDVSAKYRRAITKALGTLYGLHINSRTHHTVAHLRRGSTVSPNRTLHICLKLLSMTHFDQSVGRLFGILTMVSKAMGAMSYLTLNVCACHSRPAAPILKLSTNISGPHLHTYNLCHAAPSLSRIFHQSNHMCGFFCVQAPLTTHACPSILILLHVLLCCFFTYSNHTPFSNAAIQFFSAHCLQYCCLAKCNRLSPHR